MHLLLTDAAVLQNATINSNMNPGGYYLHNIYNKISWLLLLSGLSTDGKLLADFLAEDSEQWVIKELLMEV